ncbi:CHAP domain-containing protein [Sphingobium subterraneum]|uniref:Surface antigen n=1 Tax=Sphingobium subterraneum TaxID=627688 RepID=A0A841J0F3_9SPHN|nr:CHAP domain-containing protein [Sphingobium subterraneum]MBB6124403.1 surface antigen [Sphingobium subterraneum]
MTLLRILGLSLVPTLLFGAQPVLAAEALQCVPYARTVSGINLMGDALTWWDKAAGRYDRGNRPRKGAVIAFAPVGPMTLGHVAVVSKVVDDREILIRHANWSIPGAIEEDVRAIDVSDTNDWSAVRVWHSPSGRMGVRINPVFGFIYSPDRTLRRFDPDRDANGARYAILNRVEPRSDHQPAMIRLAYRPLAPTTDVTMPTKRTQPERTLADIIADVKKSAKIS